MSPEGPSPRAQLRVADHVRVRVVGDQAVLLDLKRSRYLGMSSQQWHAVVASMAAGGQSAAHPNGHASSIEALVVGLHRSGIVTTAPARHRADHALASPTATVDVRNAMAGASIDLRHLGQFIDATARAALWLRLRSLQSIALSITELQRSCVPADSAHNGDLLGAIAVFDRLRPLAFTSREKCLFDSLALTIFLARRGMTVRWVIGVATQPFSAHSWVQDGAEVLNDLHERVRRFQPLLVV